jgi:hypothetical protein
VHEFQAIDEYMANKINDHKRIKQHHELFQDKSKIKIQRIFFFIKTIKLTLHSKPESLSLFDDDDFLSSLLPEDGGTLLLSAEVSSVDAI